MEEEKTKIESLEEFDYELEAPFDENVKTPVTKMAKDDPCPGCLLKQLIRMTNLVPPPTSIHEAARFNSCVSPIHSLWYVCAVGPFLGVPMVGLKLYFGPDRRKTPGPAPGQEERRQPPPIPSDKTT